MADEGLLGLSDFVGYPAGQPVDAPVLGEPYGILGISDFVGYPVGQPQDAVTAAVPPGFFGLLDFVGYPIGLPAPVARGRGKGVGGRRLFNLFVQAELHRSVLDGTKLTQTQRVLQRNMREQQYQDSVRGFEKKRRKKVAEAAMFTILLSES